MCPLFGGSTVHVIVGCPPLLSAVSTSPFLPSLTLSILSTLLCVMSFLHTLILSHSLSCPPSLVSCPPSLYSLMLYWIMDRVNLVTRTDHQLITHYNSIKKPPSKLVSNDALIHFVLSHCTHILRIPNEKRKKSGNTVRDGHSHNVT